MQIHSTRELFERYSATVMVAALVGNFKPSQALRLAGDVWQTFPAFFPDFATDLLESDARAACWRLAQALRDTPGAFDVWSRAREIAWIGETAQPSR